MELEPYPECAAAHLPWTETLPSHWRMERAKWLFQRMQRPVRPEDAVVTCFRDGTVTLRKNRRTEGFTESLKEIGYQGVRRGDLVIHAMDAFAGAIGVSDSDGKSTPVYSVCAPRLELNVHYYANVVREMARCQWIVALAKGIRERSTDFRYEAFANEWLPFPPVEEQDSIASFVHGVDTGVKRLIRAKRRVIELLNEQKQAIIHRAVNQGLGNSIGSERGRSTRLKFVAAVQTGLTLGKNYSEYGLRTFPYLRVANVQDGFLDLSKVKTVRVPPSEANGCTLKPGDVLMTEGGDIDKLGRGYLWNGEIADCLHQNHIFAVRVRKEELLPEFLSLLMTSPHGREYFQRTAKQTTNLAATNSTTLRCFPFLLPPVDVQRKMIADLDVELREVDHSVRNQQVEINLLREYSIERFSGLTSCP